MNGVRLKRNWLPLICSGGPVGQETRVSTTEDGEKYHFCQNECLREFKSEVNGDAC